MYPLGLKYPGLATTLILMDPTIRAWRGQAEGQPVLACFGTESGCLWSQSPKINRCQMSNMLKAGAMLASQSNGT